MNNKGLLLIISGPSGCGKGTVCKALLERNPEIKLSISATTREVRVGEKEGVTYFYKTKDEFEQMIKNDELLEYVKGYSDQYYGTPKEYVAEQLDEGNVIFLEIEMKGALNVKSKLPETVTIFLAPPSLEELHRRLVERGRESAELIEERFNQAKYEMTFAPKYDYIVVNDTVDQAVERIKTIIAAEKFAVCRNGDLINELTK
jgi:guanylate kinase